MESRLDRLFPRDLYGRLALGIASLFFVPVATFLAFAMLFWARPQGVLGWLIVGTAAELFMALALFFTCGLIWAMATPRWLERFLDSVTEKLAISLLLFILPLASVAVWAFMQ